MLLDTGVGIFLAILTSKIFLLPLSWWLVLLGIGFALLVDIDAIVSLTINRGVKKSYKHRDLFHRPLLFVPLGVLLIGILMHFINNQLSLPLIFLFATALIAHFIHDSIGLGWGIKWLWPFNKNNFSFFYQYNAHRHGLPMQLIYVWKNEEIDNLEEKYGDPDWFRQIYLSLHPYGLIEIAVFIVALIFLFHSFLSNSFQINF